MSWFRCGLVARDGVGDVREQMDRGVKEIQQGGRPCVGRSERAADVDKGGGRGARDTFLGCQCGGALEEHDTNREEQAAAVGVCGRGACRHVPAVSDGLVCKW